MRFSDVEYRLPKIEAIRAHHVMTSGTTLPMTLDGVDRETGERGQFVVKFRNANRMTISSSARELIAAWIAMEFDLPVVEPVIINLSEDFVGTLRGRDGFMAASQSLGENYGSRYRAGFQEILEAQKFSQQMEEVAARIYAFDLFVSNTDRGHQKNNVHTNGEEFLIFDHELSFSHISILSFLRPNTPWVLLDADQGLFRKHVFYKYLKGNERDFTGFVSGLDRIDPAFWQKVEGYLPKSWRTDEFVEIRNYISEMVENKEEFADQLTKSLLL